MTPKTDHDLWQLCYDTRESVARIEEQLVPLKKTVDDHEDRLRSMASLWRRAALFVGIAGAYLKDSAAGLFR